MRKLFLSSIALFALWLALPAAANANGLNLFGGLRSRSVQRIVVREQVQVQRVQQIVQVQKVQQVRVQPIRVQAFSSYYAQPFRVQSFSSYVAPLAVNYCPPAQFVQPYYAPQAYYQQPYTAPQPQQLSHDCCQELLAEIRAFRQEMSQRIESLRKAP